MKYRTRQRISYFLKARHKGGHGIHSPFLFRLVTEVIENKGYFSAYSVLRSAGENVRNMLRILDMRNFLPAPGSCCSFSARELKSMHLLPERFDLLLFRLVNEFSPTVISFHGSTFGTTLLALAMADSRIQVKAHLVNDHYLSFCRRLAEVYDVHSISFSGNQEVDNLEFVVIQHPADPPSCVRIVSGILDAESFAGVIVLCGLHTTPEMTAIWENSKKSPVVRITLDLYEIGILICRKGLQKEDFILRY